MVKNKATENYNSVMELITKASSSKTECRAMELFTTALVSQLMQVCGPTTYSTVMEFSTIKTL